MDLLKKAQQKEILKNVTSKWDSQLGDSKIARRPPV
jgi:hypothetical protein